MSNHTPLQSWPPKRLKTGKENTPLPTSCPITIPPSTLTPARPPFVSINQQSLDEAPPHFLSAKKAPKTYQNGYESKPKTPSFTPFKLNNPGHSRQKAFAFSDFHRIKPVEPLTSEEWNSLAVSEGVLGDGQRLWEYQVEAANIIISRERDLCVVAPTGAGKSHTWILPLLVQKGGISLVIIPYTSLGFQGEQRHSKSRSNISCTFLHSGASSKETLESIARGGRRHVVYTCVEMLETPAIAQVLHAESFQAQLSAVYIDEAHVLHESHSWRPSYARLHILRTIIGTDVPLVPISATLPKHYRCSLQTYAGLRPDYYLINLGNYRPELSTIIANMQHPTSSFLDLTFVLPWNSTTDSIQQTIIYADNLDVLTGMFWWFHARLGSMNLPVRLIDILHAGLSETHQEICMADFMAGKSKILLGSDKIGAGMDFPHVTLVVQYRCRGLTLVRWEQRRGRGGRREGLSAIGVILVEKSMTAAGDDKGGKLSPHFPQSEDPALLELIHTKRCQVEVVDRRLENPPRKPQLPCTLDSNCNPDLQLSAIDLTWIMEDPRPQKHGVRRDGAATHSQNREILEKLRDWRLKLWDMEWKDVWPSYGPENLVSDADLEQITRRACTISTVDDLNSFTQIPHLDDLGDSLLCAIKDIYLEVVGPYLDSQACQPETAQTQSNTTNTTIDIHGHIRWAAPKGPETVEDALAEEVDRQKYGQLAPGEFVLEFN